MEDNGAGHRSVPHTADLRIEAWAPTREGCIAEAVIGTVECFLDIASAHPEHGRRSQLTTQCDEDLLVAVLDEVIYYLDTAGEVPVDVEIEAVDGGLDVRFAMVDATALPQIGAVPKAVSLHELSLGGGPAGWQCSVTLDV
jgi:SHS2 domain-containing protein